MPASEILQQVTNFPDAVRVPEAYFTAGVAAIGVLVMHREVSRFDATQEAFALSTRGNQALLDQAILEVDTDKPAGKVTHPTWKRLGSRMLMTSGLTLGLSTWIAHPTFEATSQGAGAETEFVLGSSYSMINTHDMGHGETRFNAAVSGLKQANFAGNLGVVQYGVNQPVGVALGPENHTLYANLNPLAAGPDGDSIIPALQTAASLLPAGKTNQYGVIQHPGEIILYSDGITSDTPTQLSAEAETLHQEGITTKVIVPGTSRAAYVVDESSPFSADTQPLAFSGFGQNNVETSGDGGTIEQDIDSGVESNEAATQKHTWGVPYLLAGGSFLVGFLRDRKQRINKVV